MPLFYLSLLDAVVPYTSVIPHSRLHSSAFLPILDPSAALILSLVLSYPPLLLSSTVITAVVVTGLFMGCRLHKGLRDDVRILEYFNPNL